MKEINNDLRQKDENLNPMLKAAVGLSLVKVLSIRHNQKNKLNRGIMMDFKAIIFDKDGVIIDTQPIIQFQIKI